METNRKFLNKTVVVTGSSSGIGRAIAIDFAKSGANVILHGRKESEHMSATRKTLDAISTAGQITAMFADFSDSKTFEPFVDQTWNWHDGVDVWVNNAGGDVLTGDWANETAEAKLDYLQQVDVKATLMLSRSIGKRMAEHQSRSTPNAIINIGWDQAANGMAGESGETFATTKGAVMSMTKSLAQSLAPHVRVCCVAPGWIKTQWGEQSSDYWSARAIGESLMARWGTPQDIANAVSFLASDDASFISGQVLAVNGGFRSSGFSELPKKQND